MYMASHFHHLAAELVPQHRIGLEVVLAFHDLNVASANANLMDAQHNIVRVFYVWDRPLFQHQLPDILEYKRSHGFHSFLLH
jgi:hypothetical protein